MAIPNPHAECDVIGCDSTYHVKKSKRVTYSRLAELAIEAGWSIIGGGKEAYCPNHPTKRADELVKGDLISTYRGWVTVADVWMDRGICYEDTDGVYYTSEPDEMVVTAIKPS